MNEEQHDAYEIMKNGGEYFPDRKIAFAVTSHKSQGQTCDSANLDPACFCKGQLYIALSRVTRGALSKHNLDDRTVSKVYTGIDRKQMVMAAVGFHRPGWGL